MTTNAQLDVTDHRLALDDAQRDNLALSEPIR